MSVPEFGPPLNDVTYFEAITHVIDASSKLIERVDPVFNPIVNPPSIRLLYESSIGSLAVDKFVTEIYKGRDVSVTEIGVNFKARDPGVVVGVNDGKIMTIPRFEMSVRVNPINFQSEAEFERIQGPFSGIVMPNDMVYRKVISCFPLKELPHYLVLGYGIDDWLELGEVRTGDTVSLPVRMMESGGLQANILEGVALEIEDVVGRLNHSERRGVRVIIN